MSLPLDLSKLSHVVKNDVKKTVYDKLVAKVNNIDTSDFVLKTKYNTDKTKLENKIPDVSNLAIKTALILICINWVPRDPRTIFLVTSFTRKMPESSDSMYSSIVMLENI